MSDEEMVRVTVLLPKSVHQLAIARAKEARRSLSKQVQVQIEADLERAAAEKEEVAHV